MRYKFSHTFRANRQYSKTYFDNLCAKFTPLFIADLPKDNLTGIVFGKQDQRSSPSITVIDDCDCIPYQRHFKNQNEMLAYMQGFVAAKTGRF